MLDIGLLVSGALIVGVLVVATRWARTRSFPPGEILDRLLIPAIVGLLAARVAAAVLDDRASLQSVRALLVIRGGVEFWVGVAVMLVSLGWGLRRRHLGVWSGLADLAPFAIWGYGAYEATCLVRDGCYGPESPIGLVPDGLRTRMFPAGLVVAAAIVALGFALRRLSVWSPTDRVLLAVGGVAAVRSLVSFWLPRLGDGLTRQHLESIAVLAAVLGVAAVRRMWPQLIAARRDARGPVPVSLVDPSLAPDPGRERA
jgi:hypothetical protein